VADYLNSITDSQPENRVSLSQEATSERLTSSLMSQLGDIAQNETAGDESHRDEELRQVVGRAVLESLITGFSMTDDTRSDQTNGQ
jgi:hypothetical protein